MKRLKKINTSQVLQVVTSFGPSHTWPLKRAYIRDLHFGNQSRSRLEEAGNLVLLRPNSFVLGGPFS